jgi:hypothetical protein
MEISVTDITNNSQALQGVNTTGGVVYIQPGKTVSVDLAAGEHEHVSGLSFLNVSGDAPKAEKPVKAPKAEKAPVDDTPKTPAEVLAMAADKDVQFLSFKAAAVKLLGEKTPAKKDEIILALEELATQP